mmetsp:Transcript_63560/g.151599  ORF Transcript_63560/g.151599 Transcript_63560/m.151599 type:complete len:452 (-) Transcript_63560:135-1490(-)
MEEGIQRGKQLRSLALISAGVFSSLSIWFSASAVLASMKQEWEISDAEGSFLTSMVNVGFCVGCLVSAVVNLPDFVSGPVLICCGSISAAISNSCMLLVGGFLGALVCRLFVGVSLSLVYPPGVKLLSTWFSAQERGNAIGVMFGAFCLGSAFPQLLNGIVSHGDWRPVIIVTSIAATASGILVRCFVPLGPYSFPTAGSRLSVAQCGGVLGNPRVLLAIVAYCGHMWELFCVWAWVATFLETIWKMSGDSTPWVAFAVISMGGPGSWCGGMLGDRYGRIRVAITSLLVSGSCIACLGLLAHEGPLAIRVVLFLIWGLTGLADSPQFSAIITISADQRYVGTAVTVQLLCGYLITILALWLVPRAASGISWRWSFFSLAAGPVVGLLALILMLHTSKDGMAEKSKPADASDWTSVKAASHQVERTISPADSSHPIGSEELCTHIGKASEDA